MYFGSQIWKAGVPVKSQESILVHILAPILVHVLVPKLVLILVHILIYIYIDPIICAYIGPNIGSYIGPNIVLNDHLGNILPPHCPIVLVANLHQVDCRTTLPTEESSISIRESHFSCFILPFPSESHTFHISIFREYFTFHNFTSLPPFPQMFNHESWSASHLCRISSERSLL